MMIEELVGKWATRAKACKVRLRDGRILNDSSYTTNPRFITGQANDGGFFAKGTSNLMPWASYATPFEKFWDDDNWLPYYPPKLALGDLNRL